MEDLRFRPNLKTQVKDKESPIRNIELNNVNNNVTELDFFEKKELQLPLLWQ